MLHRNKSGQLELTMQIISFCCYNQQGKSQVKSTSNVSTGTDSFTSFQLRPLFKFCHHRRERRPRLCTPTCLQSIDVTSKSLKKLSNVYLFQNFHFIDKSPRRRQEEWKQFFVVFLSLEQVSTGTEPQFIAYRIVCMLQTLMVRCELIIDDLETGVHLFCTLVY